jgi:hypothetical protein
VIGEKERGNFNGFYLEMTAHENIVDLIIVLGLLRDAGVRGVRVYVLVRIYGEGILQKLENGSEDRIVCGKVEVTHNDDGILGGFDEPNESICGVLSHEPSSTAIIS